MMNHDFENMWNRLRMILMTVPSTQTVFNQYLDHDDQVDLPNAESIRITNLYNYMSTGVKTAKYLVIGEAAGPWGCRFSGIPFTGERQLLDPSFPIKGQRTSKSTPLRPTRITPPFISRTAEIFWEIMIPYHKHFLVWDAFPFHPHKKDDTLTVRNPTRKEVYQFGEVLKMIKEYMNPIQIVSIGKIAYEELKIIGLKSSYVRHPSRGGIKDFIAGIQEIFN